MHFRFSCPEENNQQPLLSHQALRPPSTPPTLVQNLHPVTCSSSSGESDQSARAASVAAAALEHDSHCALNFRRNNATNNATRGTPESEVAQESVDLLRMLPEARAVHAPRESNPRRANRMYGPMGGSSGGSSLQQQQSAQGPAATGTLPGVQGVHREADESAAEDSSGFCDDSVVYYTSIPCSHNTNRTSLLGGPSTGVSSGGSGRGGGANSDPEERIAFLSSTYSTLNRNKRNNGGGISLIGGGDRSSRGASNVAEYCTSKSHSRSCGNLTCPRGYDKNRLGRSLKQIYPDYKNKRKKQQLRNIKRWTFLTAIFVGIILAITGIIVAFLVYAPFHLGSKYSSVF